MSTASWRDERKLWSVLSGIVRRVRVSLTRASGLWQLRGYQDPDGNEETFEDVAAFQGVGYAARPKAGASVEAIVVGVGAKAHNAVIVATRDRTTKVDLEEDETAIFTSVAKVKITKDGDIELTAKAGREVRITDGSGTPKALVTKDDFLQHTHATAGTGTPSAPGTLGTLGVTLYGDGLGQASCGTAVLKAE